MSTLSRKLPSVHSLTGCNLTKPSRPFGQGLVTASGRDYWSDELAHLESLLAYATPERRITLNRRIDDVMEMMFPF